MSIIAGVETSDLEGAAGTGEHAFGHCDMAERLDKSLPLLASRARRVG